MVACLLLLSYLLYYVPPQKFALLSVLSLSVPLLIILNVAFLIYWLIKLKPQLLLSTVVLILGYRYIHATYQFSKEQPKTSVPSFSVMTYNVRLFNLFNWIESDTVKNDILNLIEQQQPDILSLQEYHEKETINLKGYEVYKIISKGHVKSGQAIFSKFPIVNSGIIKFPKSSNNAIYIDVLKENDTIRIYNVHLQSSGINTDVKELKKEDSNALFKHIGSTFKAQQSQAELVVNHIKKSPHKVIVTGDFNNTAYSYVYKELKGQLKDTFIEAGQGFGRTFDFKLFPVRIDFILTDASFTISNFETYTTEKLSDHFPIKATLEL